MLSMNRAEDAVEKKKIEKRVKIIKKIYATRNKAKAIDKNVSKRKNLVR